MIIITIKFPAMLALLGAVTLRIGGLEALWPIMDEAPLSTSKFATRRSLPLEPQKKK